MRRIGVHTSFTSVSEVINGMKYNGLNTLQIATRNMRNMQQRATMASDLQQLSNQLVRYDFYPLVIHAPYALNPASPDYMTRQRCLNIIKKDMEMMPNCAVRYVLHPGSYMSGDAMHGMARLCELLSEVNIPNNVYICVEMMAGAGTQLMSTYEELDFLCNRKIPNVRLTFDSCHVFAAGMFCTDIMKEFQDWIKVVHLNGSEGAFRSHIDRHASVVGNALWERVVQLTPDDVPIILETPSVTMQNDIEWLKKVQ